MYKYFNKHPINLNAGKEKLTRSGLLKLTQKSLMKSTNKKIAS